MCQAWYRTSAVQVLVPGDRGAEGEEQGKGVVSRRGLKKSPSTGAGRRAGTGGGPRSLLLANQWLGEFDKELEKRRPRDDRSADAANIDVQSRQVGEGVMASVTRWLAHPPRFFAAPGFPHLIEA